MPRISFITRAGDRRPVDAVSGQTILEAARANDIELQGTCGGSMVCATCHVRISPEYRAMLPAQSEDEEDTLDLAFGVTPDSRLGCQITLTDAMDGMDIWIGSSKPTD